MNCYADLHCHSRFSNRPSQFYLQLVNASESNTEPRELYRTLKRRGMNLVTITDHDTIDGVLEIAHHSDVFVSEELTCLFPEDGCKVHVLVFGIDEDVHRDLQKLRNNIYEVSEYLDEHSIAHSVAHPFYRLNDRLKTSHIEKLLLLFRNLEEINAARTWEYNRFVGHVLDALSEAGRRCCEILLQGRRQVRRLEDGNRGKAEQ